MPIQKDQQLSQADLYLEKALACLEVASSLRTRVGVTATWQLALEYLEQAERAAGPEGAAEIRRRFEQHKAS